MSDALLIQTICIKEGGSVPVQTLDGIYACVCDFSSFEDVSVVEGTASPANRQIRT